MKHKKVEMVELFYDLVLVYAVSKTTGLIHHLEGGVVDPMAFGSFLVAFTIVVNAWMYQAVFTNRYGSNSPRDMAFSFVSMGLLLYLSNTITVDWEGTFAPFTSTLCMLFLVQFVQYALAYRSHERSAADRFLIRGFLLITGVYAAVLLAGSLLPYRYGIWFSLGGLVFCMVVPVFFRRRLNAIPFNFPHLVERLTLLTIITFGEMIVGVAGLFTPETFGVLSVLVMVVAVALFVYYLLQFDYLVDVESPARNPLIVQYAHLPLLVGLGMVTVSYEFLEDPDANHLFVTAFMYTGMAVFYLSVFSMRRFDKPEFKAGRRDVVAQVAVFLVSMAASLALAESGEAVAAFAAATSVALAAMLRRFYHGHRTAADALVDGDGA